MSLRKNSIAWAALFVALGGTSYAATQRSAPPGCYPKGSITIAQDKAGRFYLSRSRSSRESWYVCAFRQGTPRRRFTETSSGSAPTSGGFIPIDGSAKVSGRYVAFFAYCHGCRGPYPYELIAIDMVTGHQTFSQVLRLQLGDFVLKPDGSIAWTTLLPWGWTVVRQDSTGTTVVDHGPEIDPGSLAAGGSWLYWTDDGSPRSASFH